MKSLTVSFAVFHVLRHNRNTLKTGLFLLKRRQQYQIVTCSAFASFMEENSSCSLPQNESSKKKTILQNFVGGNMTLDIFGTGGYGTPRCIFLTTNLNNYVFNCGEGMQRLSQEHKAKLARIDRSFITSCKWENIGGLIGLGLTMQAMGKPSLKVHCPKHLSYIMKKEKGYPQIANMDLKFVECKKYEVYNDTIMSVCYVPITPSVTNTVENNPGKVCNKVIETSDKPNGKRTLFNNYGQRKLFKVDSPESMPATEVLCYICTMHDRPGSLDLTKCVEFGVPPGPLLGQLKSGMDITLEDGTEVRSTDVCKPKTPGPIFIVVDVPSKSYLESFLSEQKLKEYQNTANGQNCVAYIFHFTPKEIVKDSQYIDWMAKFGPETLHILFDEDRYTISSEAIVKNQFMLNLIHPKIFPILPNEEGETKEQDINFNITDKEGNHLKVHLANALDTFYLFPKVEWNRERNIKLLPEQYIDECLQKDGFPELLSEIHSNIETCSKSLPNGNVEYPKIVMLGTGCSVPCKYRNTSGILLRTDENNSILLDCGEGIYGQIQRRFNKSECTSILKNIKGIFISHLHADHHLGLFSILLKRSKLTNDPICVIAPDYYQSWLHRYHRHAEQILDSVHFYPSEYLNAKQSYVDSENKKPLFDYLNVDEVSTTKVRHPGHACGVAVTLKTGQKITYSGDTMPTENLVLLGANSDLLIHEATMDDTLVEFARKTFHTTMTEAIEVGRQMNAKFTLLTHFSQRYAKVPFITGEVNTPSMKTTGVAYDFMDISLSQLSLLPLFYPALLKMFAEEVEAYEVRVAKKIRRENQMLLNESEL